MLSYEILPKLNFYCILKEITFTSLTLVDPFSQIRGCRGHDHMIVGFMQSVPITSNVVSSNPTQARCIRYNIMS